MSERTWRTTAASLAAMAAALVLAGCPPAGCCIDDDADGYCGECGDCGLGSCVARDCDDDDPTVHPFVVDGRDGIDRDCDGTDLGGEDTPCSSDAECRGACNRDSGRCTNTPEACDDGVDQDRDDRIDCEDRDCADACAEALAAVCAAPEPLADGVAGSFEGASDLLAWPSLCTADEGRDRLYQLADYPEGELLISSGGDETLALLDRCSTTAQQLACLDGDAPGGANRPLWLTTGVAKPAWLLVQEASFGAGADYELSVDFSPALCGDGAVVLPEACDDGNTVAGDGCDGGCQPEPSFDPCAGAAPLEDGVLGGTTAGGSSATAGSCGGVGRERSFVYTPAESGTLELRVTSDRYVVVYARQSCTLPPTELGCALQASPSTAGELSVPVTVGIPVYLLIDAYEVTGPIAFELEATLVQR